MCVIWPVFTMEGTQEEGRRASVTDWCRSWSVNLSGKRGVEAHPQDAIVTHDKHFSLGGKYLDLCHRKLDGIITVTFYWLSECFDADIIPQ